MLNLYIVRHGQTEENQQRILQGHLPGNLTETGKEQVRSAARNLVESGIEFNGIVSSDLKRALDSAYIIGEQLNLPVTPLQILRERDWGKYTGLSVSEAKDKYFHDGHWQFPDSAETDDGIQERAHMALQYLLQHYNSNNLIVVTHGQFARNLVAARFNCSYHEVTHFHNAEIRPLTVGKDERDF